MTRSNGTRYQAFLRGSRTHGPGDFHHMARQTRDHQMTVARSSTFAVLCSLFAATMASAQSGSADLRYVGPFPDSVVFVTIDSISSTTSGLPTGDMNSSGIIHSTSSLTFAVSEGRNRVTARLHELTGQMSTPMGDMPLTARDLAPLELELTEKGPDAEEIFRMQISAPGGGNSPESLIGAQRALSGLVTLPGRVMLPGETWADTVLISPTFEGLNFDIEVVVHGTYEKDTTVAGRTLNMLRISTEMRLKSDGTVQGMKMTQDMTSASEEVVLWDPALRIPASRRGTAEVEMTTSMPDAGMSVTMNSTTRSHTVGSLASGE